MLAITVMLLNRDRITARELAEKFEVSVRTIYRDIDAINLAGIPVVSFPGWYSKTAPTMIRIPNTTAITPTM